MDRSVLEVGGAVWAWLVRGAVWAGLSSTCTKKSPSSVFMDPSNNGRTPQAIAVSDKSLLGLALSLRAENGTTVELNLGLGTRLSETSPFWTPELKTPLHVQ